MALKLSASMIVDGVSTMSDAIDAAIRGAAEVVLIAGATASGKSRLALGLAERIGGLVINADSMQVYAELRILSARPSAADEAAAPHRLYGHVRGSERYSVGRWLDDVKLVLAEAQAAGCVPILVGGTGLYFKALTEGLAAIPATPAEVRARIRAETSGLSSEILHDRLRFIDPESANAIRPSDRSRITRALEVFEATGRSLRRWREAPPLPPLIDRGKVACIVVEPDRALLHDRIAARAEGMIAEGAIDEARALIALGLDPELPAMKAIGVRELGDHIAGRASLSEAIAGIKTETRRYAKRQMTWFRHQMPDWPRLGG
jgi:tRNA dimethylallyltransferase